MQFKSEKKVKASAINVKLRY